MTVKKHGYLSIESRLRRHVQEPRRTNIIEEKRKLQSALTGFSSKFITFL